MIRPGRPAAEAGAWHPEVGIDSSWDPNSVPILNLPGIDKLEIGLLRQLEVRFGEMVRRIEAVGSSASGAAASWSQLHINLINIERRQIVVGVSGSMQDLTRLCAGCGSDAESLESREMLALLLAGMQSLQKTCNL